MFCEEAQEKSQCFCVSSALIHLTHSILPQFCPISLKRVTNGFLHYVSGMFFSWHFPLDEKTITLMVSCSGWTVFLFILFCQSLGISFKICR